MNLSDFNTKMMQSLRENGLNPSKEYLGISKVSACPRQVVRQHLYGFEVTDEFHRLSLRSFAVQNAVIPLLQKAGLVGDLHGDSTIDVVAKLPVNFSTALRGRVDAVLDDDLGNGIVEVKTVSAQKLETIKKKRRAEPPHFKQVQAFMHFGHFEEAVISYWDPESFEHYNVFLKYIPSVGKQLEAHAIRLLQHIENRTLPDCECGRCAEAEEGMKL